jgi:cyclophilin family peptidyl-prolyl cis-trans isomerase
MRMLKPALSSSVAIALAAVTAAATGAQSVRPADARKWEAIAAAENARAPDAAQLATLFRGARDTSIEIRRISVRALGRLQRAELTDSISVSLHDASPAVRAEAAKALALANIASRAPVAARDTVRAALRVERDARVLGALAETLGRLRCANSDSARIVAAQLATYLDREPGIRLGAARGLHFILRQGPAIRGGLDVARDALIRVATAGAGANAGADATAGADTNGVAQHARRMATETLALAGFGSDSLAARIMRDTDPLVRREAVLMAAVAAPPARDTAAARRIAQAALKDSFWLVRFEGLRQIGTRLAATSRCVDVAAYNSDPSMHVRLEALDILGARCGADDQVANFLYSVATTLPPGTAGEWRPAAHALVSLAARDPKRATEILGSFLTHPNFYVRTYAANAASALRLPAVLRRLALHDAHPNVRTAAVHGLRAMSAHNEDSVYIAQLALDDSQLLMEAAAALDSTSTPGVAEKLLDALDRVTAQKRENSRDGRMALLNVAAHLGVVDLAPRLRPYLQDFDPQVATRAAAALKSWTGADQTISLRPLPPQPMPTYAQAAALEKASVRVEMASGLAFSVRFLPFDAPTNAARFANLIRSGYFNGLSLHRVEPNFVVQGGSPNANEYLGAPRFSRDEIGYPNDRGTIGLSTRGHDTGDAQIFINIVDNTQLDPLYTVFAVVTRGMSDVDRILEGDVIRKISFEK